MKPRVVILSAFLTPFRSGAEACAEEVALELSDRFDITIVTARLRSSLARCSLLDGRVNIVRVGIGHPIDKWLFPFLAPFAARKLQPDIIHAVLESFAGMALVVCSWIMPETKRMLTCQSTNTQTMLKAMHKAADSITCISSVLIERAQTFGRSDAILIPNGIHYDALRQAGNKYAKVMGRLLFVGRLEPMKGIDTLIRAFAILHRSAVKATLRIVGGGSLRRSLEELAHSLGVGSSVLFCGYKTPPDLYREFAEAEIFCGLSRSEALGNVFLEAQAAGCAVLATDVGGIPDVVQSDQTGVLIPPDDHHKAAEQLALLLREGAFRNQLVTAARKNAEKYDWQGIAEKYAEAYQRLL